MLNRFADSGHGRPGNWLRENKINLPSLEIIAETIIEAAPKLSIERLDKFLNFFRDFAGGFSPSWYNGCMPRLRKSLAERLLKEDITEETFKKPGSSKEAPYDRTFGYVTQAYEQLKGRGLSLPEFTLEAKKILEKIIAPS